MKAAYFGPTTARGAAFLDRRRYRKFKSIRFISCALKEALFGKGRDSLFYKKRGADLLASSYHHRNSIVVCECAGDQ
jgi:hypothetical protein